MHPRAYPSYRHYTRTLGDIGDMDVETEVVLIEHDVPTAPWTVSVLKCLPQPDYEIPEEEIKRRVDLRHENICSIDPPGCSDIDDALHCKQLPNGNFEVPIAPFAPSRRQKHQIFDFASHVPSVLCVGGSAHR
jgi:exosome complex exonuclease DIS3/RRP44